MLNHSDIMSTVDMIDHQHLDIRTITMGISLLDCADPNAAACAQKIYDRICRQAEHLVDTGCQIERELGIPIVNKRISVTPIALVAAASETEDFVPFAKAMDRAAKSCGVDFIGGFSALVHKGMASGDRRLIAAIPQALAETELVCSSVNVATTKAGINMDAVRLMGQAIKKTAALTAEQGGLGCAKLVVFCNAVEDNPFMAGAFHGVGEADAVVSVGVSGPGVVHHALQAVKGRPFDEVAECIKKVHDFLTIGAPAPLQEAICAAFQLDEAYYAGMLADYTCKRALFCGGLDEIGLPHSVPQGSYFVMADISTFLSRPKFAGWTDLQFCEWMVKEVGVAAVPGSSFFAEPVNNLIRLHFARSEASLQEAINRMKKLQKYL